MGELTEIRERIARRTEERRTEWLHEQQQRYFRWLLTAAASAAVVMVVAILAKSIMFGVVAAYLWLFAYNRWMEYRRTTQWLSRPRPTDEKERLIWARIFYNEMSHPSFWLRASNRIAAVTAAAFVLAVSVVVITMSGFWTRLLYGIAYGLAALYGVVWGLAERRYSRDLKDFAALNREIWRDLT